jgi:preprotein translocase subunit SecA
MATIGKILTKIFGSRNDRLLKRYRRIVEQVAAIEEKVQAMTDEQLRERTLELHLGLTVGNKASDKPALKSEDVMPEAFAIVREAMDRNIGIRSIFAPEEGEFVVKFDLSRLDAEGRRLYDEVQQRLISTGESYLKVPFPLGLYNAVKKAYPESRPPFRARPFDVQIIGGLVLYEGRIAEMATGEGKTFVAPLACYMRVLEGYHCHVVTVNDYLVKRDASWIRPAFEALGLTVGYVQSDMEPGGDTRRKQYECDVTYGTNSEFGFDYLRDNMKERRDLQVQGSLDFAIVDEVDSILIDEARTPLIISGAAHDDAPKYKRADEVARKVMEMNRPWTAVEKQVDAAKRSIKAAEGDIEKAKGDKKVIEAAKKRREQAEKDLAEAESKKEGLTQYYEVELDRKSAKLTHEGWAAAQEIAGVGSFFVGNNMEWPHLMEQAMRAHVVYEKDKDYVIERGKRTGEMEVIIVDEYTGRKMEGRQWSDGLHQSVEAKERVPIKQETQTLATITLQNFFKLYKALSGMTGTAQTEAEEFSKIYKLEVVTIPTNRPLVRQDNEDRVYRKEGEKWEAIIDEIKLYSDSGRPVLVGTTSVEKSEMLSNMLKRKYGIEHEVLNAKFHERESHIVAFAGQTHLNPHGETVGNVTIATNMAGRGTDIKPAAETFFEVTATPEDKTGGKYVVTQRKTGKKIEVDTANEEDAMADVLQLKPGAKVVGGLHVIGTERHTARRIDNQLRGRSGRQGDAGSSRFYVSLEDDLMAMFAGEWTIKVLGWLGMEEGMAIEDKKITKGIVRAQKKVEERNFLSRKNLLDYDEVMDYQRTSFYGMRQQVLEGRRVDMVIWKMIGDAIRDAVDKYITQDFVAATSCEWARTNFEVNIDPEDLKGRRDLLELEHYIKDQARNQVENDLGSTLEEYLGEDPDDQSTWDSSGLSSWAMSRFHVSLPVNQIKKMDAEEVREKLRESALAQIEKQDVEGLAKYLEPLFSEKELITWAKEKFAIELAPTDLLIKAAGRDKSGHDDRSRDRKSAEEIVALIEERARQAYARREIEYPVDHVLALAFGGEASNVENPYAAEYVRTWAKAKYNVDIPIERMHELGVRRLRDELIGHQERMLADGKLKAEVAPILAGQPKVEQVIERFQQRFGTKLDEHDLTTELEGITDESTDKQDDKIGRASAAGPRPLAEVILERARGALRQELTDLEQFVLIQIFDQSWKDHLYAMDILKGGVGLLGFAERDPRIVYKKEGFRYFEEMMSGIRDKVTDLIFRARVVGRAEARSNYRETAAVHQDTGGYGVTENLAATADVGKGAPLGEEVHPAGQPGRADPAGNGTQTAVKTKPIVRQEAKVGRNDPCPCGSGKKYKKCCGQHLA